MEPYDKDRSARIRREIRNVLLSSWDPIGVRESPEAADEYDSYLGDIFGMLERRASQQEVADYLRRVETEQMGLTDRDGKPFVSEQVWLDVAAELQKIIM